MPRLRLGRPRKRPDRVRADKAYDSRKNRTYLRRRGIKATIPVPADRVRNRKNLRPTAACRPSSTSPSTANVTLTSAGSTGDKLAVRYEATVLVAANKGWL
ncbi:hypothetical protein [Streptomyces sp. NPDC051364]|uniref:hypothetical protein n=1 Tax=Streptomyces sp. NPDC051364 TaxID=3155799 RepID=UPI0034298F79